jgi:hypothetical protein
VHIKAPEASARQRVPVTPTGRVCRGSLTSGKHLALPQTVRGLRISQSAGASVEGGSTLSLTGGNLHLEKNTTFTLTLNEALNVGRDRDSVKISRAEGPRRRRRELEACVAAFFCAAAC